MLNKCCYAGALRLIFESWAIDGDDPFRRSIQVAWVRLGSTGHAHLRKVRPIVQADDL